MPTIAMIGQKGLPARSGGVERHVQHLATSLVDRGHRVIVFGRAWYVGQSKAPKGVQQVVTPGIKSKHLDAITHSVTAIFAARKMRPDIVHVHGVGIAILLPLIRLVVPRAKIVVTFHCIDRVREKWGFFARAVLTMGEWMSCHLADRTVTVSQELARYCAKTYGVQPWYITHAIPNVVPPTLFEEVLEKHDLKKNRYFLFVGRLISDKGAHLLVDAYAKITASPNSPLKDIPLVLIGASSFTDEYAKRLCHRAAKIPNVHYLGERVGDELLSLQAGAMAHVFPSSSEGLSLATIEACQLNKTVIATDIEANFETTGGWMVPVKAEDVDGLATALLHVAGRTDAERQSLGERARMHVERAHDVDARSADMIRVYADALGATRDLVTPIVLPTDQLAAS